MDFQKRKRNYYTNMANNQKKRKQLSLEPGMRGFLCTCNFREKDCVRDAYKILNEFSETLYKSGNPQNESEPVIDEDNDVEEDVDKNDDEDISTALTKEISDLKAEYSKPMTVRQFQVVDTGVKNVIFIKTTLENPLELVTKIITDLDETKKQRTRFLLRLLPIEAVCKAYMADIKVKAEVLLEKYFAQEPKTFSIIFNRHSNNSIQRDHVIQDLAEIIAKKNPGNKADLKNPELAVVVEVIRGVCLMSIAPHYYKYKKYNLLEICNVKGDPGEPKKPTPEDAPDSVMETGDTCQSVEEKISVPEETKDEKEETDKPVEEMD